MRSPPVSQNTIATGVHRSPAEQTILFGAGQIEAIGREAERLGRERVFIVTTASVAATPLLARVRGALGPRAAGEATAMGAHTPLASVAKAAADAIDAGADMLVSLGGGSVIDATKCISFAIANGICTQASIGAWLGRTVTDADLGRRVPHMAIPTTASAAEFTGLAGVLVPEERTKAALVHPRLAPDIVVHDPTATLHTPMTLWLSTAIRSLDHAVEALYGPSRNAYTDALAGEAVRLLFAALPACHASPEDLEARAAIQSATWLAGHAALGAGTSLSHGIGYLLGGLHGVPHGLCSCVTLPAVMAWNLDASIEAQARIARLVRAAGDDTAEDEAARRAAAAVRDLIARLGLPTRLSDVIALDDAVRLELARLAFSLPHAASNPRRPTDPGDLEALIASL